MHRRACLAAIGIASVSVAGCADRRYRTAPAIDGGKDRADGDGTPTLTDATETERAIYEDYETTRVRAMSQDGDLRGTVTAAIADTTERRYLGLSDTETLPRDRGMLFVYEAVADRTFVMRGMNFGIDIVFADGDGVITTIHHAPKPDAGEDGNDHRYTGRGRYVLEVVYGWTHDHGVSEGDVLEVDDWV